MSSVAPATRTEDIAGVVASHRALYDACAGLDDETVRAPSLLPGWSVGHVLTHVARNADSFVRVLDAAREGKVSAQYPDGQASRDADIEAGAARPASELLADLASSNARLEEALAATTQDVWATGALRRGDSEVSISDLPIRRWQEVEVHRVDLGLGYGPEQWPERFVVRRLEVMLPGLAARLPAGMALELRVDDSPPLVVGDGPVEARVQRPSHAVLAWLYGRSSDPQLPVLGAWS
jgi:maleylpyruvate isomerase